MGFLALAVTEKRIFEWPHRGNQAALYATIKPPELPEPALFNHPEPIKRKPGRPKRSENAHG